MNGALLSLILSLFGGALLAVQAPTNALLGKASGSPIAAAFISFLIGTLALGATIGVSSGKLFAPGLKQVPWYAWLGGSTARSSSRSPHSVRRGSASACF